MALKRHLSHRTIDAARHAPIRAQSVAELAFIHVRSFVHLKRVPHKLNVYVVQRLLHFAVAALRTRQQDGAVTRRNRQSYTVAGA